MNNGLTTATTISPKQYQIHNSLDRLQEAVDRQEALRNDLYFRLDTVMRPTEPCPSLEGAKVGSGVPLCLRIDVLTDRLASNNDALKDILDRLEV